MNKYSSLPLVSVCIPVYGRAELLSQCLNSIINQSYKNLEIIIIYTDYKDSSLEVCNYYKNLDSRIKILSLKTELNIQGPDLTSSIKLGFNKALGKYVCSVDSDDYIDLTCIEQCVNFIEGYGLVYTYCRQFGDINILDTRALYPYSKEKLLDFYMVFSFRLFLKSAWNEVNSLTKLTYCYDYDLVLRLSEVTDFILLPKVLYYWRRHKNQNTNLKSLELKKYEMELCRFNAKIRRGLI